MRLELILAVAMIEAEVLGIVGVSVRIGVILSVLIFGITTILHDLTGLAVVAAAGGSGVVAGNLLLQLLLVWMRGVLMLLLV